MNFLVTGATGFIGRRLVASLLSRGHSVNYLGRKRSKELDSRAAFFCWNPDEQAPLDSVPRLDAVIHLAGEPIAQRWNNQIKQRIYSSRVDGTRAIVGGIERLRYRPAVLVSASAIGYYGDRGEEVLTEDSRPGTDFLARLCVDWEREALRAREFGLRVAPVRIAAVLGRNGGALQKMLTPFKFGVGGRLGSGRQWMSWIHLDDLVALLVFAAESPALSGPVNGSSPAPVTNAEFTAVLSNALHRPAVFPVPRLALRLALGELADYLFVSERVAPKAAQDAGFSFRYPELVGALKNLLE
ncbi:MAG TPA: TIGR01777 family oxidoreductase [Bryobacteraceae bacterium]|jgi:uncharacterized protein (TIGR01777 family)|nr:TIGR01777 family oxidoreductase [Bryobacteraceae bacterium]